MRYCVTRDQAVEHRMSRTDVAMWKAGAFDNLKMDENGEWTAEYDEMIFEVTAEDFEKECGLEPPRAGTKRYLIAEYKWE
jgi:hypothetical protein